MAAKRKTRSGRKPAAVNKSNGRGPAGAQLSGGEPAAEDAATADGSGVAQPTGPGTPEPAAPAAARPVLPSGGRPVAPTTGPVSRGGAGFSGVGRGQGAGSARRYAFRRS